MKDLSSHFPQSGISLVKAKSIYIVSIEYILVVKYVLEKFKPSIDMERWYYTVSKSILFHMKGSH